MKFFKFKKQALEIGDDKIVKITGFIEDLETGVIEYITERHIKGYVSLLKKNKRNIEKVLEDLENESNNF